MSSKLSQEPESIFTTSSIASLSVLPPLLSGSTLPLLASVLSSSSSSSSLSPAQEEQQQKKGGKKNEVGQHNE